MKKNYLLVIYIGKNNNNNINTNNATKQSNSNSEEDSETENNKNDNYDFLNSDGFSNFFFQKYTLNNREVDFEALRKQKKKKIEPLAAIDHTSVKYPPFNKVFYEEHEQIKALSEEQIRKLRYFS